MCWSICEGSPAMSSRHAHSRFDRLGALICTCTVRGGPTGRRHTYWRSAIHSESEEETLVLCPLLVVARAARLDGRFCVGTTAAYTSRRHAQHDRIRTDAEVFRTARLEVLHLCAPGRAVHQHG